MTSASPASLAGDPAATLSKNRRRAGRAGWLLAVLLSVSVGLLSLMPPTSQAAMLVMMGLMLVILVGMFVAAALLMWRYRDFFGRARGFLFLMAVFFLTIATTNQQIPEDITPLVSAAINLFVLWGFVAALAIGPALWLYLIRTDRSVAAFAITYLLTVWLLFSIGQFLGWDVLLERLMFDPSGTVLWPLQGGLCIAIWVTIAAPFAFLWNTVRYLRNEQVGVVRDERG